MRYIDLDYYSTVTGDYPDEGAFLSAGRTAEKTFEALTTGVDGVCKLKEFTPVDEDDLEDIKLGICNLARTIIQIEEAERASASAFEYTVDSAGGVHSNVIASKSSGSESISYAAVGSGAGSTAFGKAVGDRTARTQLYNDIAMTAMRGICDSRGVRLLYGGAY